MTGVGIAVVVLSELLALCFLVLTFTMNPTCINPALGLGFGGLLVGIIDYWVGPR
jgi:hypothetical protein